MGRVKSGKFGHQVNSDIQNANSGNPDERDIISLHLGLDAIKPVFGGLPTTQEQTSLRIPADCSGPFVIRFVESLISKIASSKISSF